MGTYLSRGRADLREDREHINGVGMSSLRKTRGEVRNTLRDLGDHLQLYKAAVKGEWKDAKNIFEEDPEALTAKITIAYETALHIAVGTGQANNFVEKLINKMLPEDLALKDRHGDTALSVAAMVGNTEAARMLVHKNPNLPNISDKNGYPIHKAAQFGHKEMVSYLWGVTRDEIEPNPFSGEIGGRLLIDLIGADFYDIALDLVDRYPETATVELDGVGSPLSVLARSSTLDYQDHAKSTTGRLGWKRVLHAQGASLPIGEIGSVVWVLHEVLLLVAALGNELAERRLKKNRVLLLAKVLCREILELEDAKVFSILQQALHDAAEQGNAEIIEEIVMAFPPAIWFTNEDNFNVFHLAVLSRRANVFNLIYQMTDFKHLLTRFCDQQGNNILHLAGRLPPSDTLDPVSSPAIQVQLEFQWFEEVSKFVQPAQRQAKNKQGKTPKMVFVESHQQLMKETANWMKQTASSSTVIAALLATVAFAGIMRVPGGNDKDGLPLLAHHKGFTLFIAGDAVSLISSVTSLFFFLNIITSRYSENDFVYFVPAFLTCGVVLLSISFIAMLVAFSLAFYLQFGSHAKSLTLILGALLIPIIVLSVLVPLLYQIVLITCRTGMFGRNSSRTLH